MYLVNAYVYFKRHNRGAGMYLNILWTNQVYLKLGVDKIQKQNIFMALYSKIGYFQRFVPKYGVDKSTCPHMFRRPWYSSFYTFNMGSVSRKNGYQSQRFHKKNESKNTHAARLRLHMDPHHSQSLTDGTFADL